MTHGIPMSDLYQSEKHRLEWEEPMKDNTLTLYELEERLDLAEHADDV